MSPGTDTLYQANLALLARAGIAFDEYLHEPVFSYATAEQVRTRFGLSGRESKSLFLRLKDGRYCLFLTLQGRRLDAGRLKALLGSRPALCSDAELTAQTGCLPQCACPFGHAAEIILVVDRAVLEGGSLLYSPGPPDRSIEIAAADLPALLACCSNPLLFYDGQPPPLGTCPPTVPFPA